MRPCIRGDEISRWFSVSTAMMKTIKFHPPGGLEKLKCEETDIPDPSSGEILIKVHAIGVIWPELTW